jgi:cytochrome c553
MKAFPRPNTVHPDDLGMELRDYFAAKALQGLLNEAHNDYSDQAITELAYSLADAMMEARNEQVR